MAGVTGRSKNLIKNPCGKDEMNHWEVLKNGGAGFKVEEEPAGIKKLSDCTSDVKENKPCWATSHDPCEKQQVVDLVKAGFKPEELDEKKPPITVREWYGVRVDCGCKYNICVRLLGENNKELDRWEFSDTKEEGKDWSKVKHIFRDYPSGVRFVEFKHGGQDTKWWAGHYGVKLTMSAVYVWEKEKSTAGADKSTKKVEKPKKEKKPKSGDKSSSSSPSSSSSSSDEE